MFCCRMNFALGPTNTGSVRWKTTMSDKLLPCPFCGSDAEQDYTRAFRHLSGGRLDHGAAIYCTSCNADMIMCRGDHPELSDEERMGAMVENWNRRTPAPETNVAARI